MSEESYVIINAYISIFLMTCAVTANTINIVIFFTFRKVRNLNNTAVTMLSAVDLLRGVVIMPLKSYNQLSSAVILTLPWCEITAITSAFTFVFNPMLLAIIAVVRYFKIVPWTRRAGWFTNRVFYRTCFASFVVAVMFAVLPYTTDKKVGSYKYSHSHGVCFTDWSQQNIIFRTIFYIIVVGLAFPVLILCYVKLYLVLREHTNMLSSYQPRDRSSAFINTIPQRRVSRSKISVEIEINQSIEIDQSVDAKVRRCQRKIAVIYNSDHETTRHFSSQSTEVNRSGSRANQLSRQEIRLTKVLFCIFIAYCVCWLPAAIVNILAFSTPDNTIPKVWFYVIVTLVELKCALNPVIYTVGNRNYRRAINSLLRSCYCKLLPRYRR